MKWMTKGWARIAGAFAALAIAACSTAPAAQAAAADTPHPAMWLLADKDTKIYLFGTFHLLPPGSAWRTPAFEQALSASQELVLEVPNIDDPMAVAQAMQGLAVTPGNPPLAERVAPEKRAVLATMIEESGYPAAQLDRLDTWAASLILLRVTFQKLGVQPDQGVELNLIAPWKASGRPISGLETVEDQFRIFDGLSEESQRAMLASVLDQKEDVRAQFAAMLAAWSRGDTEAIARTFNREEALSVEMNRLLIGARNAKWADTLARRMERPGTVFVAVGAGHLAGPQSVQRMLEAKGFTARRLQ
jgi:uncharacterized protein YbaP (TraB family)